MKVQMPGEVKMVMSEALPLFEKAVQELVDDGYAPFSGLTDSNNRWSILMMKPKMVEIDEKTGEPVK